MVMTVAGLVSALLHKVRVWVWLSWSTANVFDGDFWERDLGVLAGKAWF
jgi:hypothetical protein